MDDSEEKPPLPHYITAMRKNFLQQDEFDDLYIFYPPPKVRNKTKKTLRRLLNPFMGPKRFLRFFFSFIPFLSTLRQYRWRECIFGDLIAGITVGIVHVPQGIAYSFLVGVDPIYGLYSSFFPVLLYMLFGTSRHVSIGSFAVISLMTGTSRVRILKAIYTQFLQQRGFYIESAVEMGLKSINFKNLSTEVPFYLGNVSGIQVVTALTFCIGVVELVLAVLHVEFIASYMSDQLISGFNAGASVHVIFVQLDKVLQVEIEKGEGRGILLEALDIIRKIPEASTVALTVSIFGFIFLYVGKDCINPMLRKCLPAPIPFELLLVCIATAATSQLQLQERYSLQIIGEIPTGFDTVELPRVELFPYMYEDAVVIAIVVIAIHLSLCKLFSRRHKYQVDNNQELYALGLTAIISSFFHTYPASAGLARSSVGEQSGGRTQLAALFAGLTVLTVIVFLAPFLRTLPMCILSVIIIYAMKNIIVNSCRSIGELWRVSKVDLAIWVFSFVCTILTDTLWGLLLSVIFSMLTVIFRTQWPRWRILSRLSGTEDYRDCGRYGRVVDVDFIRVFRFDAPLLFTNVEHFRTAVEKSTIDCPLESLATLDDIFEIHHLNKRKRMQHMRRNLKYSLSTFEGPFRRVEHLVIDCSGFTFVDFMSVQSLIELYQQIEANGVQVYFAGVKAPVRDVFEAAGLYEKVPENRFYPTIHDAVQAACMYHEIKLFRRGARKQKLMVLPNAPPRMDDEALEPDGSYRSNSVAKISIIGEAPNDIVKKLSINDADYGWRVRRVAVEPKDQEMVQHTADVRSRRTATSRIASFGSRLPSVEEDPGMHE